MYRMQAAVLQQLAKVFLGMHQQCTAMHQNDHLNIFFRVAKISKYNNGSSLEINFDCINYDSKTSKN